MHTLRSKGTRIQLFFCLLGAACFGVLNADEGPSFALSMDPTVKIVEYVSTGGMVLGGQTRIVVWGDGRLQHFQGWGEQERIKQERELTREQVEEVVQHAVEGNLASWNEKAVMSEVKDRLGTIPYFTDQPHVTVQVNADRLRLGGEKAAENTKIEVTYSFNPCGINETIAERTNNSPVVELTALCLITYRLHSMAYNNAP